MAKKASKADVNDIISKLCESYGKNIVSSANYIFESPKQLIPISPAFDNAIKGFYEGSLISLSGKSQCGKTSFALDFAKQCQKPEYGERDIYYYDVESRLGTRSLEGIDFDKFFLISSQPGKILTGEQYLQIAYELISAKQGAIHIIDSLGIMGTSKELLADMGDTTQLGDINRLINKFIRKIASPVRVNKSIVFAINHVYANMGYGGAVKEKISSEVTYLSEYRLLWKSIEPWTLSGEDKQIGQIMNIDVIKSATSPPNQKVVSYLRYEPCGLDRQMETIVYAIDIGLIKKGGPWFTMVFERPNEHLWDKEYENDTKIQGQEGVRQYFIDNPDKYDLLNSKIKELVE